jgi:1,2-diacylglycerol 3-alpha-glucosyltransferase
LSNQIIVGILTNTYPPNKNGVAQAVYNLQRCLEKNDVKVFIVTPKVPYFKYPENVLAIKSNPLPKSKTSDLRYPVNLLSKAQKFFRENRVSVIHTHDTFIGGLEGVILGLQMNIPVIHTYHTMYEEYEYFKFLGYKSFIRSFSQIVCSSSQGVICLSSKIKEYLVKIGVEPNLYSLPNPIDKENILKTEAIRPERIKFINKFIGKIDLKNSFNIITFGRVAQEKNIELAIDLVCKLNKNGKKTNLVIAGEGARFEYYKAKEKELSDQNIFLFGSYDFRDLTELSVYFDLFLSTSFSEVLPTTPLEAMILKLPVYCVNDKAYDYIVKDGYNGVMGTPDILYEALLYSNKKSVRELSENAYKTALEYLSRDFAKEYLEYYSRVIANYEQNPKKSENPFLNSILSTQYYLLKINQRIKTSITSARF